MTQEEIERSFITYCMEMRLQGVHPDWFAIWLGANELTAVFVTRVRTNDGCPWPTAAHMQAPDLDGEASYRHYYNRGLPRWSYLVEKHK